MNFRPTNLIDSKKKAKAELDRLWRATREGEPFAVDSEFDPDDALVSFSYSWGRGERHVVWADYLPTFAGWFESPKAKTVFSFFKADCRVFDKIGLDLRPSFFADVVSLDWFWDENNKRHGLKQQVYRHLGRKRLDFKNLFSYVPEGKKKAVGLDASQVAGLKPLPDEALVKHTADDWRSIFVEYGGDDGEDTILLFKKHRSFLQEIGYWPTYLRIDRKYTVVLMACEDRGMLVDRAGMEDIRVKSLVNKARSEHAFLHAIGKPDLNLNAKEQVKNVLLNELDWPAYNDLRTKKTRDYQMSAAVVRRWVSEGIGLAEVLLRRGVFDKLAKDMKSLLSGTSEDDRLRTELVQHGTVTGRISSKKWDKLVWVEKKTRKGVALVRKKQKMGTNLQNVVSEGEKDPYGVKRQFVAPKVGQMTARGVPAEEDHDLVVVDMSGFELVLTVNRVGEFLPVEESKLLATMLKYGNPSACHVRTCIELFDLDEDLDDVCKDEASIDIFKKKYKDQYRVAKEANFGLCYGGTWRTLARRRRQDARLPKVQKENEAIVYKFFNVVYPELVTFQEGMIARGYEKGYVETLAGRRVNVAEGLASTDRGEREHWERKCCNIPQADAADIIKEAMVAIEHDEELRSWKYRQLVQVHDEIVGEAPRSTSVKALARVQHHMCQPHKKKLRVGLSAAGKTGLNWHIAKG